MSKKNLNSPKEKNFFKQELEKNKSTSNEIIPIDYSILENIFDEEDKQVLIENPDKLVESINNITETYESFGKEYGIDLKYDIRSVSSTFKSIITSNQELVFKLYLSKAFSKVKLSIFNKILIAIATLVDRITQKEILESDNIELGVQLVEKLLEMMTTLNEMSEQIEIKSVDTVLKKVSEEISSSSSEEGASDLSKLDVMSLLKQIKYSKNN